MVNMRLARPSTAQRQTLGNGADAVLLRASPAVQACRRLGQPDDYLYRPYSVGGMREYDTEHTA
jgi:hypothetical protein